MAFIAGVDLSTGDIVQASDWNNYNGADGSIDYLHTEFAKLDDITFNASPGLSDDGTVYRNTSGGLKMVQNSVYMNNGEGMNFVSDSNASPTTSLGDLSNGSGSDMCHSFAFLVPNDYYFKMTKSSLPASNSFTWDEH